MTGAMTLQLQLTILRTLPSTCACCPERPGRTEDLFRGSDLARRAHEIARSMKAQSNFQRDVQPVNLRRAVEYEREDVAVAGPRRQKANAVLIRFLSGRGCSWIRVEGENECESKFRQYCRVMPSANDSIPTANGELL